MSKSDFSWEQTTITQANAGSEQAGREALDLIVDRIAMRQFDSPLFDYLAENLELFLNKGVPLSRALKVEPAPKKGGRPRKYDENEIMAAYFLLTDHGPLGIEAAFDLISEHTGADRSTLQAIRREYDARYCKNGPKKMMESVDRDVLLLMIGSLREKVEEKISPT